MKANKNILVLYHANCLDGFGAAYAAWVKFGDSAEYIPVQYGISPPIVTGRDVYILDFSYKRAVLEEMKASAKSLLVLDHHKSAQEDLDGLDYAIFDMSRSGAIMAWEYFHSYPCPVGLELIQDRDLWLFKHDNTKAFTAALRAFIPMEFESWSFNLGELGANELADRGRDLLQVFNQDIEGFAKNSHKITLSGIEGLACNVPPKYSSELGNVLAKESGTFGATYCFDGASNLWLYSLRSIEDFDVSKIALEFGGGGHKNAAGFSSTTFAI
jgi:oligoribonuclease NrnB/cAMP/cGMP phosphodiesterase (DHH superfamily)